MTHSLEGLRQSPQEVVEPELVGVYFGELDENMKLKIKAMIPTIEAVDVWGSAALLHASAVAIEHTHQSKHANHAA